MHFFKKRTKCQNLKHKNIIWTYVYVIRLAFHSVCQANQLFQEQRKVKSVWLCCIIGQDIRMHTRCIWKLLPTAIKVGKWHKSLKTITYAMMDSCRYVHTYLHIFLFSLAIMHAYDTRHYTRYSSSVKCKQFLWSDFLQCYLPTWLKQSPKGHSSFFLYCSSLAFWSIWLQTAWGNISIFMNCYFYQSLGFLFVQFFNVISTAVKAFLNISSFMLCVCVWLVM